ncbi:AarF/ABC1/UbiB kinase family protein [Nocardia colli]|uniref:AarF/ABC1/UbiB kinase family protein n=1 Tax=Nocardia colli TaxID=2545717 RepID=A0A5N0E2Z6_9NOCA|nr:AarF/UbiB family protein [Nocardia colli]KAA8883000.1 AarF/ABC1/UbiB kinase family protein [Nocardia colli]
MFRALVLRHARPCDESRMVMMTGAAAVFVIAGWGLMVWLIATVARRVIGSPVGWPRTIVLSAVFPVTGSAAATGLARKLGLVDAMDRIQDPWGAFTVVVLLWAWIFVLLLAVLYVAEIVLPSGSIPGPIALFRAARRSRQEAIRYWQLLGVLIRHGLGGFLLRGSRAHPDRTSAAAANLRDALNDAGVTFVKLGQMLSTRRDVIPATLADQLATLQTEATPLPWAQVELIIAAQLGRPADEVFESIEQEPLAAASVGQAHAAVLVDGRQVVVKVQRPGARVQVGRDLQIMRRFAGRLEREAQWAREMGVADLVEGFAASLTEELDYTIELDNMRNLAAALRDSTTGECAITIPVAYPEYSSSTMLVMQRLDGTPVGSARRVLDKLDSETRAFAASTLLAETLRQILVAGVFHADLHPGNVLVDEAGRLGLLDFGAVGRLDETERLALAAFLVSIEGDDSVGATEAMLRLLGVPAEFERRAFERRIGQVIVRFRGGFGAGGSKALFTEMIGLITSAGFAIPGQIAGVFRTLASVEGTLLLLDPGFELLVAARQVGDEVLAPMLAPDRLAIRAKGQALAILPVLQRLPGRIDKLSADLEAGRFSVGVRVFEHPGDRAFVSGLVQRLITALFAAACVVAAAVLLVAGSDAELIDGVAVSAVLAAALGLIGAVLGIRTLLRT